MQEDHSPDSPLDAPPELDACGSPAQSSLWNALAWVRDLVFSVMIAVILIVFIYQPVKVEGTSMMPTLADQERIFINKFTYRFGLGGIERGDTVVFWWPPDPGQIIHQAGDRSAWRHRENRRRPGDCERPPAGGGLCPGRIPGTRLMGPELVPPKAISFWATTACLRATAAPGGMSDGKTIYGKAVFVYWPLDKMAVSGKAVLLVGQAVLACQPILIPFPGERSVFLLTFARSIAPATTAR